MLTKALAVSVPRLRRAGCPAREAYMTLYRSRALPGRERPRTRRASHKWRPKTPKNRTCVPEPYRWYTTMQDCVHSERANHGTLSVDTTTGITGGCGGADLVCQGNARALAAGRVRVALFGAGHVPNLTLAPPLANFFRLDGKGTPRFHSGAGLPSGLRVPAAAARGPARAGWQLGYFRFRPAAGSLMLRHRRPPIQTGYHTEPGRRRDIHGHTGSGEPS
jgi:hypothetical protein